MLIKFDAKMTGNFGVDQWEWKEDVPVEVFAELQDKKGGHWKIDVISWEVKKPDEASQDK